MNSWAIQMKPTIMYEGNVHPFSMISIQFAPSGQSKDSSYNFFKPIDIEVEKVINRFYRNRYDFLKETLEKKDDIKAGEFTVTNSADRYKSDICAEFASYPKHICQYSKNGTIEGISTFYKAFSKIGIGSIGVSSSELADYYQDANFKNLLYMVAQFYNDLNPSSLKITASNGSTEIKNIQSSIRLHGSFSKFKNKPNLLEDFQSFMASSLARRSLYYYMSNDEANELRYKKVKYKEEKLKRIKESQKENQDNCGLEVYVDKLETPFIIELRNTVLEVIKFYCGAYGSRTELNEDFSFINPNVVFRLNNDAYNRLFEYGLKNNKQALEYTKSNYIHKIKVADELDSKHLKALRIAALSCFYKLESNRIIDIEDVEYALSITDRSSEYYKIVSKPNIIVDDICHFLDKTNKKVTVKMESSIPTAPPVNSSGPLNFD
jgi:hypothetical protein